MTEDTFRVRIAHLVPDGPTVDFLVDGTPVLSGREYGDIPAYTAHQAGEYEVSVRPVASEDPLLRERIRFDPGAAYTVLFVGTATHPEFRLLTDG